MEWQELEIRKPPEGRWGFSLSPVTSTHIVMVGGISASDSFNDVHVFDITRNTWMTPTAKGTKPTPRWGHTATTVVAREHVVGERDVLVVFGGREGAKPMPFTECYTLDLTTFEWTKSEVPSPTPRNRYGHTAELLPDSRQVRFGWFVWGASAALLSHTRMLAWMHTDCRVWGPWWPHAVLPRRTPVRLGGQKVVQALHSGCWAFKAQWPCHDPHWQTVRRVCLWRGISVS